MKLKKSRLKYFFMWKEVTLKVVSRICLIEDLIQQRKELKYSLKCEDFCGSLALKGE